MNKALLKSKMALYSDTGRTLAEALEIAEPTFSAKLNGYNGAEFTQKEIAAIRERYKLTDEEIVAIFFAEMVS